ncbi:sensor histidine kinase [Arcobacter roscoffensis]|uniref:histidine kinase n=1 Tax=Arcobacter roscoffensis TaxID=2961520 RepID=A0ABY5E488_9BACT|nr:cache domain-containing protein [Arcobacter roscoffensis]UTJ05585.1 cache domain-containing protein [Arcobacter roscoffensis]
MIFEDEKKLLKIIKFAPTVFIIIVTTIFLLIQYTKTKTSFENEKNKIQTDYSQKNKELIKQRVSEVYDFIKREQEQTEYELKSSLNEAVDNAYAIASTIYNQNKDKDIQTIKKLIIDALRNIRFLDGRGYYFVYENTGKNILLPHNPELEGKDFWEHQDAKGSYIIKDMTSLLSKKDKAFYEWYWYNPKNPDKQRKKLGLVRNFEPFDWFIGTGEYVQDFEKQMQERVLNHIREIRYGNSGYIFIINYDSIYLSHIRKNFINQNAVANNDTVDIKKVIEELIDISKNGEGYYSYIQNKKPGIDEPITKTSYVKGLNEWQWMIGTGFYEDEIKSSIKKRKIQLENQFENYLLNTLEVTLLVTVLLLLISTYLSKILQKRFLRYKKAIEEKALENTRQHTLLSQQSKMAAMGEMIGNIAHQWRQPLSTISTVSTGLKLQKELNIIDDKDLYDGLDNINNTVQYLSNTIDDFRNFFRTDKEKSQFSVQESFDNAISLVKTSFHNKEIEIIKNSEDYEINSYKNELIQVIINLLNNAKDELIKKDKNFEKIVFLSVFKEDNSIKIQVKDNAGGIPEDIIDRVFEPYFTTKHQSQGTGIGLYMSREIIVKNMNGKVEVYNTSFNYNNILFKGAVFQIDLPLHT